MTFRVGQQVCCIQDRTWKRLAGSNRPLADEHPVRGPVYVVSEIKDWPGHGCAIRIAEFGCNWYLAQYFRPVQKRKTDISCFTMLLKTKSEKELV